MCSQEEEFIAISPHARDPFEIPDNVSFPEFALRHLSANLPRLKGKPWIHNVDTGFKITFDEVESLSRRVASALTRRGFKKGDTLYYVNYDCAKIFVIVLAVWRLGGIIQGWYQKDVPATYVKQINRSRAKFILIDDKTRPVIQEAISMLDFEVTQFCFGDVEGATSVDELFNDDGSAFPEQVQINPREDVMFLTSSSGSTGEPKAIMHTHYTSIAGTVVDMNYLPGQTSCLISSVNYSGILGVTRCALCTGGSIYVVDNFNRDNFLDILEKYKPEKILAYPFLAAWFARSPEIKTRDLSFLKIFVCGGSHLDCETVRLLNEALPHVAFQQAYGMSECQIVTSTAIKDKYRKDSIVYGGDDGTLMSVGNLTPYAKARVIDMCSGLPLGPGEKGMICVKIASFMLGYQGDDGKPYFKDVDEQGWFKTGDYGYIDADSNVFLMDRMSFLFYCYTDIVIPSEIESVIQEHPSVQAAGVIGVYNIKTGHEARAYVVVKRGHHVTADEIKQHVASRFPFTKQLHGGVKFVDALPENRNEKLDRLKLREWAKADKKQGLY